MRFTVVLGLALAAAAAARAAPFCPNCEEAPPPVPVEDAAFVAAGVELLKCPSCGDYYWGGGWHGAFDLEAERKHLARAAAGIPDQCPACGGPLDETYAYVVITGDEKKPSYLCYKCWTVVFPDGTVMSPADIKAFEAERKAEANKRRVASLVNDFGWTEEKAGRVVSGEVVAGDEPAAVREAWGTPARTGRALAPTVDEETWYYADGRRVDFKDGKVTATAE